VRSCPKIFEDEISGLIFTQLFCFYCKHKRTGRHFTGGAEKICPENNNLP